MRAGGGSKRSLLAASALALVLLGATSGCGSASGGGRSGPSVAPDHMLAGLDAYITQAVADWGLSGLSIAVVKDDEVVFARGYGEREAGGGSPIDENTLFAIGSNTKLFTAVAAGLMVDQGRMKWDDPVSQHLPGFQLYDPWVTREITIRDLLSHRSGLGRRGDLLWYGSEHDRSEILRRIRFLEPNSSFRAEYGYQNVMFLAAGEATARAAGRSWDELVQQGIFEPLGMRRSNTGVHQLANDSNVATPHALTEDGILLPMPWRDIGNIAPAGSINSSALEMAEWLRFLLRGGRHGSQTLIRPETLDEIFTPQTLLPLASDSLFPSTHFRTYGLGIVAQDYEGREVFWHTGGIDGMLSLVSLVPEEGLGLVVLTNTGNSNNLFSALMYKILDSYLGGAERDWSDIMLRQTRQAAEEAAQATLRASESRVTGTRPSLDPGAWVGLYEHPLYGDASVTLEGEKLVVRRGPGFTGDLEHWHYNTYRATWRHIGGGSVAVTFMLDVMGRVRAMQLGDFGDFQRVVEPGR